MVVEDVLKNLRSTHMSRIRSKDTKPEMLVRKFLFSRGFRYRIHVKKLPGKPDVVLPKYRTVVFVHGCFWHGHEGCKYYVVPKTRTEWWLAKITRNRERDEIAVRQLAEMSWRIIQIFGCELKSGVREETLASLEKTLRETPVGVL